MSLSLVPEYDSSESEKEEEAEEDIPVHSATTNSSKPIPPASRGLGAKLASVLPPPRNRATTADSSKVRIVVDLGQPTTLQAETNTTASGSKNIPAANASDSSAKRSSG
ncbi:hypothetical protein IWW38_003009, partial [Coemansia aciculifera]